jgi:hypothetical protein
VSGAWQGFVFIRFQKNEPPGARLQRGHEMKLRTKRVDNHPPCRLCSEKGREFCAGLVWRFFREEVTAVKSAAAQAQSSALHGLHTGELSTINDNATSAQPVNREAGTHIWRSAHSIR